MRIEIKQTIIIDSHQLREALIAAGQEFPIEHIESFNGSEQIVDLINFPNPIILQAMIAGAKAVNKNIVQETPISVEPKENEQPHL